MTHLLHKGAVTKVSQKKFNFGLENTLARLSLATGNLFFV